MKTALPTLLALLALVAALPPRPAFAWNLNDHRDMARLALKGVAEDWGLNRPCDVHPLSSFLDKLRNLRPEIADAWQLSHYLKINPKVDIGAFASLRHPAGAPGDRKMLTPLEILALYSTDPDDGRDQDLFVRDEKGDPQPMFPDQKWFGPVRGPNSQAFRHMEKPPFRLKAPLSTLGIPFRSVGEASERTQIYFDLSQLAFAIGEEYWGWRFLAGGLHYLEDLHQPYHAGQITPLLLRQGLGILLSWGWKEKGFMGSFSHVVSNSHRFFETYVSRPEGRDAAAKSRALKALEGSDLAPFPGSVSEMAREVRNASNAFYAPLARAVDTLTGGSLAGRAEFHSDGDEDADDSDPVDFLRERPDFEAANKEVFEIVQNRFAAAGRSIRTYVHRAIESEGKAPKPEDILEALDTILGPSDAVGETE